MDRLSDDELIELLGTLGVLRLEVGELRELAQSMVPRDEIENRRKRVRLIAVIALVVLILGLIPFAFVLSRANTAAHEAQKAAKKSADSQHALIQDQYNRAIAAYAQCQARNVSSAAIVNLVKELLKAEQDNPIQNQVTQERITAYSNVLKLAKGPGVDCAPLKKQAEQLIGQGAKPEAT